MGVRAGQIEVELIEADFGQEVGPAGEGFKLHELVFDEAVDGPDITLIGVGAGGNTLTVRGEGGDSSGKVRTGGLGLQLAGERPEAGESS